MKNILIKHGITPDALNRVQLELFLAAAENAKAGEYAEFEAFLEKLKEEKRALTQRNESLKKRAGELAQRSLRALEQASPSRGDSVLSAFGTPDKESFAASHRSLILNISEVTEALSLLLGEHVKANNADVGAPIELTLRKAALAEFSADTDIFQKYAELCGVMSESGKDGLTRCEATLVSLADALKDLCEESDAAFMDVTNPGGSYASYVRVIARYTVIINDLSADLRRP